LQDIEKNGEKSANYLIPTESNFSEADIGTVSSAPLLFIVPGLTSDGQTIYVRNLVDVATENGY